MDSACLISQCRAKSIRNIVRLSRASAGPLWKQKKDPLAPSRRPRSTIYKKLVIRLHRPGGGINWPPKRTPKNTKPSRRACGQLPQNKCFSKVGFAFLLIFLVNRACRCVWRILPHPGDPNLALKSHPVTGFFHDHRNRNFDDIYDKKTSHLWQNRYFFRDFQLTNQRLPYPRAPKCQSN